MRFVAYIADFRIKIYLRNNFLRNDPRLNLFLEY